MLYLSPHFTTIELACHHCGHLPPNYRVIMHPLLDMLESFRAAVGNRPVTVNDAYRCPSHNAAVGGVSHSQHELGLAADIQVVGLGLRDMYWVARRLTGLTGVELVRGLGAYDTPPRLHVDVRQADELAQWAVVGANETQRPITDLIPDAFDPQGGHDVQIPLPPA